MPKIGKGISVPKGKESAMQKKSGGSNVGKYKDVSKSNFAGPKGGAPMGSYPINTEKRAKSALTYAHNAPNPGGIRAAVMSKYPSLNHGKAKKGGKK